MGSSSASEGPYAVGSSSALGGVTTNCSCLAAIANSPSASLRFLRYRFLPAL